MVADDVVSFGTVNLDSWALYRNSEIAMIARSPEPRRSFEERLFEPDIARSNRGEPPSGARDALRELALGQADVLPLIALVLAFQPRLERIAGMPPDDEPLVTADGTAAEPKGDMRLAILLAMAMFVLVVDTSLMNVSISAVVRDLDTTASGVQSAIALEALVSAAFILIGSKIADLIGRKRAYVLGLLGYAAGALSMTLSQSLLPIIIFWAIVGGLGAALLLPVDAGPDPRELRGRDAAAGLRARRRRGRDRRRRRAAAWRLHHDVPLLACRVLRRGRDHRDRARRQPARPRRPVHRPAGRRRRRRDPLRGRHGRRRARDPRLGGRRRGGGLPHRGRSSRARVARLVAPPRKRDGKPALLDVSLFESKYFRLGISSQTLQQIALGGLMIALPIYLQMVLEYNAMEAGLSLAPLSLTMFAVALLAGKKAGDRVRAGSSSPGSCCWPSASPC